VEYVQAAERLGRVLVKRGIGLVYGGASVGMMGKIARSVVARGGEVIGVIPEALVKKEVAFEELADLRVVGSMHERKALMADLADGFVALPGGLGTLEEFLEVLTWAQLGLHSKPCGLLNVCSYFGSLISFLDKAVEENFIRPEHRSMVLIHEDPDELLNRLDSYEPPKIDKAAWIRSINKT
jgi:uncharacterized protein (TIGR00730 family)